MRSLLNRWILLHLAVHVTVILAVGDVAWATLAPPLLWTPLFALAFYHPWLLQPLASRRGWLLFFLACLSAWTLLSGVYRVFLGAYPNAGTLEFMANRPDYAWVLARDRVGPWLLPAVLLGAGGVAWVARGVPGAPRSRLWKGVGLVLAIGLLLGFQRVDATGRGMAPDVMALRTLVEFSPRRARASGFVRAMTLTRPSAPQGPPPPFNILFIVNESLNADGLDPMLRPALKARLDRGEILAFPRAYASASMTDLCLPSLFTGVASAEPMEGFYQAPLPWHRGRAHGMATAFFSVQRMEDGDLADLLLVDGLDQWRAADREPLPLVNDLGCLDGNLLPWFRDWLRSTQGRPTLTVLHFNATHAPYLQVPGFTPWTADDVARLRPSVLPLRRASLARYWNAIAYLDHLQEEVLRSLEEAGHLEDTWVISTSDHGENFDGPAIARQEDLRPATLQVPLWMRLPRAFPRAAREALAANRTRLTSNLDLMPTLADALGDPDPGHLGASLLRPLKAYPRQVVADNQGEIRVRRPRTVGLVWEEGDGTQATWRWVKGEGTAWEGQRAGGWEPVQPTPAQRGRVRRTLAAMPVLLRSGAEPD
ncbi:sulfatase-like hydrolase/transferase [Mesoterricola sediminis]|uniref:Sulfatase N-terminal domain-containing protein n=1 Tax=Mesoterricola sediminis TaxID=2927980 RepID=A0AA48GTC3_9BACT|nr:sulfatase-like hydrolase/transferase [Mesoterricola sediminis]BDU77349.1 hypothetical protein METESE_23070 [Mesoterricola sediminis]